MSHLEHLHRFALARCGHAQDAEDAVHDAIIKAVQAPLLDPLRARNFLLTVVAHKLVDQYRSRTRLARLLESIVDLSGAVLPEERVCELLDTHRMRELLARNHLTELERVAVIQRAAGASTAEIAARFGKSSKAVECAARRGRHKLAELRAQDADA